MTHVIHSYSFPPSPSPFHIPCTHLALLDNAYQHQAATTPWQPYGLILSYFWPLLTYSLLPILNLALGIRASPFDSREPVPHYLDVRQSPPLTSA